MEPDTVWAINLPSLAAICSGTRRPVVRRTLASIKTLPNAVGSEVLERHHLRMLSSIPAVVRLPPCYQASRAPAAMVRRY